MAGSNTTLRVCRRCGEAKPLSQFNRRAAAKDGLHPWCRPCSVDYNRDRLKDPGTREAHRLWRAQHDSYERAKRVRYLYQVDEAELLAAQGGGCAICASTEPGGRWGTWHVDHDHRCCVGPKTCGSCVRGLLCANCNTAIGKFGDRPDVLDAAANYLRRGNR